MRSSILADVYKAHVSELTHYVESDRRYVGKAGHDVFVFTFVHEPHEDPKSLTYSPRLLLLKHPERPVRPSRLYHRGPKARGRSLQGESQ